MKLRSLLLVLLLLIATLTLGACSSDKGGSTTIGGNNNSSSGTKYKEAKLKYTENDTGWTVSVENENGKYGYFSNEVRIPSTYEGKPVTAVSARFTSNPDTPIKEIHIPASVTALDVSFDIETPAKMYYEGSLADWCNMTFGNGPSSTGFYSASTFQNVSEFYAGSSLIFDNNGFVNGIFDSITSISDCAFACAAFHAPVGSTVNFTNTVTIGNGAFYKSGVSNVTFGGALESIGDNAFRLSAVSSKTVTFAKDDIFIGRNVFDFGGTVGTYLLSSTVSRVEDGITSIATGAFAQTELSSVSLPYTLKAISKGAFITKYKNYNDKNYVEVNFRGANKYWFNIKTNGDFLKDGVVKLNSSPVSNNNIVWPADATTIPPRTFCSYTNLKKVQIPEGITSIGEYAFSDCKTIEEIHFPDSLQYVADYAFYSTTITGNAYAPSLESFLKIKYNSDFASNVDGAFYFGGEILSGRVVLPDVTKLSAGIFAHSEITEIVFPDTLTEIPSRCMRNITTLTSVTFGKNTVKIGDYAFYGCSGLESVTIPESVTEIGDSAFESTSLSSITLHEGLLSLGRDAFDTKNMYEVAIPSTVTKVYYPGGKYVKIYSKTDIKDFSKISYNSTYRNDQLERLYIDIGEASIGANAFKSCTKLKEVVIASAKTIQYGAFSDCYALTSLTLSENLKAIFSNAFQYCSMSTVVIPDSVVLLDDYAFADVHELRFLTLGKSLASIGENYSAFSGCKNILEIYDRTSMDFGTHMAAYNENIISVYKEGGESACYVENGMLFIIGSDAATLLEYSGTDTVLTIPEYVKGKPCKILSGVFKNNTTIQKVIFPSTLKEIPAELFMGSSVSEVVISEGVEIIGDSAFESTAITSVHIPASVVTIGESAFERNSNLVTVTFADNSDLDTIGSSAFAYTGITSITLPTVSSTGRYCFAGCSDLEFLSLGTMSFNPGSSSGLTRILGYLFSTGDSNSDDYVNVTQGYDSPNGWYNLTFAIPASLKTVEVRGSLYESAFDGCTMIETLILRDCYSVHVYALTGCSPTMKIYYEGDAPTWNGAYKGTFSGTVVFIEDGEEVEIG